MKNINSRQNNRIATQMKLRSVSLPHYSADVLDISATGARVKLKGRATTGLLEARIRFGVSHQQQMNSQFEGFARVAWIKETENGFEAGLEWEKLTGDAWLKARGALVAA